MSKSHTKNCKKYFYVYNRACEKPKHRHLTLESAIKEATRLSLEQKRNFYVLAPVEKVYYDQETGEAYGVLSKLYENDYDRIYEVMQDWINKKDKENVN